MVLSQYNPEWPNQFVKIKSILLTGLEGTVFRIEHVGSTSVKGLSAKPKIDMDIVIPQEVPFEVIREKLAGLGYYHRGDLDVPGREVFDRVNDKKFYDPVLDKIVHNLYACYEDNIELERHVLFRDYIRGNPEARIAYEKLKQDIAERSGQDVKKYVVTKETEAQEFVYSIVEKARLLKSS
ncbi:MAG: GrpB family protein [Ignavibacteria bacterium]|nr:GrpB family protein [Ignavibacteria bacterium]